MRPLRHKGGNICMEGPLCPSLMEIQSSSPSPCSVGNACCKTPKWTIMCLQSRRVKRPQMEIGIGGRDTLIQLRAMVIHAQMGCAYFCVYTSTRLCMCLPKNGSICTHAKGRHMNASRRIFMHDLLNVYRLWRAHT